MRRLPRLAHGSASWELPLADCTARALEEALLSTSERGCRRRLAALFAGDPALFLWAICQAQVLDGQQLRSCSAAAQWLAVRLVTQFDWPSGGESGRAEVARPMAEHYARLAAAGVVTGRLARRLAETEPGVRGDTVSNVTKPAKLETGITIQVPPFVQVRDRVRVDPSEGKYLERIK